MEENIFRKKSMDRVSSPEALNDYVRVATPSVWIVLSAVIVLLIGICVWGVFGRLDTKLKTGIVSQDGVTTCYIPEDMIDQISVGMEVLTKDKRGSIVSIIEMPVKLSTVDDYLSHLSGLQDGQWVYEVKCDIDISDGIYEAEIITESVAPMSFVIN